MSDKAKGKRKEVSTDAHASSNPSPARESSPVWDIELDLDNEPAATTQLAHSKSPAVFDIDLDLN